MSFSATKEKFLSCNPFRFSSYSFIDLNVHFSFKEFLSTVTELMNKERKEISINSVMLESAMDISDKFDFSEFLWRNLWIFFMHSKDFLKKTFLNEWGQQQQWVNISREWSFSHVFTLTSWLFRNTSTHLHKLMSYGSF